MTLRTVDGRLVVVSGASRSGKTAYTRQHAGKSTPALAWDPEEQWSALPGWTRVETASALVQTVLTGKPGRYAFVPHGDMGPRFDLWARCCFTWLNLHGPITCIAEELADVTTTAKAPAHWGILLRRGLKRGAVIYAISQRWAEADKTALGNASEIVIFRASSADDVRYLSKKTRVPADVIDGLKPLEFVRYDTARQSHQPGKLRF